jgi:hypothetical protein
MAVEIPYIPQTSLTDSILSAIQLANQHQAQQAANAVAQKNSQTAADEAATATQRLGVETPLIAAQTTEAQNRARQQALDLANQQRVTTYLTGDSTGTTPHPAVANVVGNQIHPDVPLAAPQADNLTVSNPMGENLAQPAPPISTDTSAQAQTAPPLTGPTSSSQPIAPVDRDTNEFIRLAGGVTPSEADAIQFARQQLNFNPTHDGLVNYLNTVHGIIQKRNDPTVAASVAFQRAGMNEPEAIAAAQRNTAVATKLDNLESNPEELTGEKASAAKAQLAGLAQTNLTPDLKARVVRLQAVAAQAEKNAVAFDAAKKKAEDDAANGSPKIVAQMLVNGDAAWSQLVSTRKPEFLIQVATLAKALDPNFSIAKNESDYKASTNPQTRATLDLITTMTDNNGSIAVAQRAAQKLPQLNSQQANSVFNAFSRSFGSNSATNFHTAMLGLADEYSKVMGGGVSSDTGRQQALDILKDAYSSDQLSGAIDTMKQDIAARKSELIRGNRVLEQTYGAGGSKDEGNVGPVTGGLSKNASGYLTSIGVAH